MLIGVVTRIISTVLPGLAASLPPLLLRHEAEASHYIQP